MLIQGLDESAHVSSLELVRQVNAHRKTRNGVLFLVRSVEHDDRVAKAGDTNLVECDASSVRA
jgi:hypothetical protein